MQYPKMLYKGNQEKYQTVIADDEDHEAELVVDGWANYGELPEQSENQYTGQAHSIDSAAMVPVEQFDAVAQKLVDTEAEVERLNNIIATGMKENTELRKQIQLKELEDMPADDLKAMLDEKGVQYGARDNKATLVNLVLESDGGE